MSIILNSLLIIVVAFAIDQFSKRAYYILDSFTKFIYILVAITNYISIHNYIVQKNVKFIILIGISLFCLIYVIIDSIKKYKYLKNYCKLAKTNIDNLYNEYESMMFDSTKIICKKNIDNIKKDIEIFKNSKYDELFFEKYFYLTDLLKKAIKDLEEDIENGPKDKLIEFDKKIKRSLKLLNITIDELSVDRLIDIYIDLNKSYIKNLNPEAENEFIHKKNAYQFLISLVEEGLYEETDISEEF